MKQVQTALAGIGIPVMAGIWRATSPSQNPPPQYVVYSTTTTEGSHHDDHVTSFRTYVYLNLWSDIDPTEAANRIRSMMYAAGFSMIEESDKGYNQPAYDSANEAEETLTVRTYISEFGHNRKHLAHLASVQRILLADF